MVGYQVSPFYAPVLSDIGAKVCYGAEGDENRNFRPCRKFHYSGNGGSSVNHLKHGLTTGAKVGAVIILLLLILAAAYLALSRSTSGGVSSSASSSQSGPSSNSSASTFSSAGLLSPFISFSQLQVQGYTIDHGEAGAISDQFNMSYRVLGKASLNSTQYTKIDFSQSSPPTQEVIAWFNPQGGIDRVDVIALGNHTGPQSSIYAQLYLGALASVTALSNSTSFLSLLSKTTQTTTKIGQTQLDVTTYTLPKPTGLYEAVTLKVATIPGTSSSMIVYYDVSTNDQLENIFQVTGLVK
jgi:hypothetical protein